MNHSKNVHQTRAQLSALAAHLGDQRDGILQTWRTATANLAELTIASSLTRVQFNDHIPGVLDAFALRLRAWPETGSPQAQQNEKDQVTGHGLQRWQQGYQLRELTLEWGHLQMVVMEELEDYALDHLQLDPQVMPTARRAWVTGRKVNLRTRRPFPLSQVPGEGVGLSIVKRLCEILDASLELETSPGEGSTFRVILPRQYNGAK